jgi:type II secretory ATPase GspE/PulE/Tfp pilus assembly ATPase PilB-like protein
VDAEILLSMPPFSGLDPEMALPLIQAMVIQEAAPGDVIIGQDEAAEGLVLILGGYLQTGWRDPGDGLEYLGPRLVTGDSLGLAEVMLGVAHPSGAWAPEGASLAFLHRDTLVEACSDESLLSAALLRQVGERLHAQVAPAPARAVDLARLSVDESLWSLIPPAHIRKYRALPLARNGRVMVVGFVDPGDLNNVDDIARLLVGYTVRPVALDGGEFDRFIRNRVAPVLERLRPEEANRDRWFQVVAGKTHDVRLVDTTPTVTSEEKAKSVSGEQVVALVNRLVGEAFELGASDIHIEPSEKELVVRYRVDGRLKRRPEPLDMRFHAPLVSRIKALGQMDIAEKRRAQDGRLTVEHGRRQIDFRLSTVATRFGEKIVLRILDPQTILIDLERLMPYEPVYKATRSMIEQSQGLVVVAGPTGSGKTTTIYSALMRLKQDEVNVVTIEDPVEYTIEGVTQVQVNHLAGISFATAVRHFLRQDPDVIVVGETRDPETAATTVEAALTGHLVFTSLHANDALGCVVRMREMGVDSFLLAHTLIGVVSQRLLRRTCHHCRQPVTYHPDLVQPLGLFGPEEGAAGFTFQKGVGCLNCNYQGYRGRVGAFEVLRVDDRLRPLLASGEPLAVVEKAAREAGSFVPLREHCRHLLLSGTTTPEEIARILFVEQ